MPDQIPFTRGVPSADLLPVDDLRAAAAAAFETDPAAVLSYAPAGYPPLRRWIAERHGTTPDRVVVVNGSLEGVDFLARHLFGDGQGTAIVEEPTYDRTIKVLRAHGARLEPLPLEEDGPDLDRFYRAAAARSKPGSGLGLAIVREAAEAHGGTASAESTAAGARFKLALPTAAPA